MSLPDLVLRPIGVAHTPFRERVEAPRQPRAASGIAGTIELLPDRHFEDALADLEGFQFLWVVFWFHANEGWRPKVLPPRSSRRRGVFATRSPYRPNPVGLSVVELVRVEGLVLHVRDVDLLDGTPILDVKPYVPWCDAIPGARTGWLEEEATAEDQSMTTPQGGEPPSRPPDPVARWEVSFDPLATEQLAFLRARGLDVETPARQVLALGPQPHAYRRIRILADGTCRLAVKEWRYRFRVDGRRIEVFALETGYRAKDLARHDPALDVHRAFVAAFGMS